MPQRRSLSYLILFTIITLSGCLPAPPPATPAPAFDSKNPPKKITVVEPCIDKNNQIFVDVYGRFCFAYPKGYYQDPNSTPESITLFLQNNMEINDIEDISDIIKDVPPTEEIESLDDLLRFRFPPSITMNIISEKLTGAEKEDIDDYEDEEQGLQAFIDDRFPDGKGNRVPWRVGKEHALVEKKLQDGPNSSISYTVFLCDENNLYKIEFIPLPELGPNITELETLFFTVTKSFEFISP